VHPRPAASRRLGYRGTIYISELLSPTGEFQKNTVGGGGANIVMTMTPPEQADLIANWIGARW